MTGHGHAERVARLLREARSRIGPAKAASSSQAIREVAQAIGRSAVHRRRRKALLAAMAGTGLCVAVAALLLVPRGGPATGRTAASDFGADPFVAARVEGATLLRAGAPSRTLVAGASWRAGDWLRSEGGAVELDAGDGTSVSLSPASELQLVRAGAERWLRLTTGTISVHVAKLKSGQRFVVMTPDAEVEVRGTRFEVDVVSPQGCGGGTVTRVSVAEGVVEVRSGGADVRVLAGGRWPAACDAPAAAPVRDDVALQETVSARRARAHSRALAGAPRAARAVAEPQPPPSTLATENDLFSSALSAERNGNRREAVELLDILLARFPTSSLCSTAASVRARLTRSLPPAL